MDILFVRHGESAGNAEGRMQGRLDYPLSDLGRAQARRLATWLGERKVRWSVAYASPLARAKETAEIVASAAGFPPPETEPDLAEVAAGELEGLTRDDIVERFPDFMARPITTLAEFREFGGESYDDVQARVERFVARLHARKTAGTECVLVVAHGGINFQLVKRLVCVPVPRLCILRMGNCTATLVRMRDRRGTWLGEVTWHVPLELMGGESSDGSAGIFR